MKTKTYVEFRSPGSFFSEFSTREVENRDIAALSVPDNAFAFQFFDIVFSETEDGVALRSGRLNVSPLHYYGGRVLSANEAIQECGEGSIMSRNIEYNHMDKVIECRFGNWQPFNEGDVFIPTESEIVD